MPLTSDQLAAINHHAGNLQLIACAGSGKTEVVARRVGELLKEGKANPGNIIAFTFTDKAAAELKERIHSRCQEALGEVNGMAELYVGTIHAFCLDLLTTELPDFFNYSVLNEVQQALFIDRHSAQSGLTRCTDLKGNTLRRYIDTPRYIEAVNVLREADLNESALAACSLMGGLVAYEGLLDDRRYLDYTAVLSKAVDVLTNDEDLRKRLAQRVRYLIVDEYQDLNPIQEAIVWLLHELGAALCVVGDDDQTVYQWRGSDVQNILTFSQRYPNVTQIRLEENFRSSEGVVETARHFIEQNAERLAKQMKPTGAQDYESGDIVALAFDDPDAEAEHIATTIRELRGLPIKTDGDKERGIAWSDMAILLRSVSGNGQPIVQALTRNDIPYIVVGMNDLFGTAEAEAARQVFYFLARRPTTDATALTQAWQLANLGIDPADLQKAITTLDQTRQDFDDSDPNKQRFSYYSIQRTFITFLEEVKLREERVPGGRGEVVFYNLGKFSQLISDFETINYHSKPKDKYETFAGFLQYGAEGAYPEGWQNNQYANPDAVRVMTIHQAKGMQWPAVFLPALLRNRFPSKKHGGRTVWHLLPAAGVNGQHRYAGTVEDERRLFYVAMTRSQKYLHMTWAPVPGNNLYQRASEFWDDVLASKFVKRRRPDYSKRRQLPPTPRTGVSNVVFSFSDLKYYFECPYQFKLRILYGFNAPIDEALGYGRSLHNALAEVHSRALRQDFVDPAEVTDLVARHLHTPYAYPALKQKLEQAADKVLRAYIQDNRGLFDKIEYSEKQIEINLGGGVTVVGRIDLVRRMDTDETTIVDFKSSDRAQPEQVTETQLHIYALGYEELTGRNADYVEIYNLDDRKRKPRSVDDDFISEVQDNVRVAADALRRSNLPVLPGRAKCTGCDYCGLCSAGTAAVKK
jgi:DNA helicase II / ATP-dependent DNA helicase PcrA